MLSPHKILNLWILYKDLQRMKKLVWSFCFFKHFIITLLQGRGWGGQALTYLEYVCFKLFIDINPGVSILLSSWDINKRFEVSVGRRYQGCKRNRGVSVCVTYRDQWGHPPWLARLIIQVQRSVCPDGSQTTVWTDSRLCVRQKQRDDYNSVCLWRTLGTQKHTFSRYVAHSSLWKTITEQTWLIAVQTLLLGHFQVKILGCILLNHSTQVKTSSSKMMRKPAKTYSFQHKQTDQLSKKEHGDTLWLPFVSETICWNKIIRQRVIRWFSISEKWTLLPVMIMQQWLCGAKGW